MIAPPNAPDSDTVRARWPANATTAFTATAAGSCAMTCGPAEATAPASMTDAIHSVAPAANATDRLSSSLIGTVSTAAATRAAAIGATIVNASGGSGWTAARHHHASRMPPAAPATTNDAVPAIVFSRFH